MAKLSNGKPKKTKRPTTERKKWLSQFDGTTHLERMEKLSRELKEQSNGRTDEELEIIMKQFAKAFGFNFSIGFKDGLAYRIPLDKENKG